jgi:hypothetical protein
MNPLPKDMTTETPICDAHESRLAPGEVAKHPMREHADAMALARRLEMDRARLKEILFELTTAIRTYYGDPKAGPTHPKYFDGSISEAMFLLSELERNEK